jgi:exosortase/archaeosortase family protein
MGTLLGYGLIFALNLLRIIVLFLIGLSESTQTFHFFHIYVSQFAVIAFTMVFWIFWAGRKTTLRS